MRGGAWPPGKTIAARRVAIAAGVAGALAAVAALVLVLVAPGAPPTRPTTSAGATTVRVVSGTGSHLVVNVTNAGSGLASGSLPAHRTARVTTDGLTVDRYGAAAGSGSTASLPATLSDDAIARLNGGRLPLGLAGGGQRPRAGQLLRLGDAGALEVEPQTQRVVGAAWKRSVLATVHTPVGPIPLSTPVLTRSAALPATTVTAAIAAAHSDLSQLHHRKNLRDAALGLAVLAALLLLTSLIFGLHARRRPAPVVDTPSATLIGHQVSLT